MEQNKNTLANCNLNHSRSDEDLISIIVPVYNISNYLEECINSALSQTYKNLEIILIDDGSKDESGSICDSFAKRDDRIRVVHKENGGLSSARNIGIEIARGKYIYFLDSDDVINLDAISNMFNQGKTSDADMVVAPLKRFTSTILENFIELGFEIVNGKEAIKRMLTFRCPGHEACGKLYKRELWDDIRFPLGELYEDYLTIYRILAKCEIVSFLFNPMYYYRVREGSIMNIQIGEKEMTILDISQEVTFFISSVYPDLSEEAEYFQLVTYMKTLNRILEGDIHKYRNEQKRIIMYAREHWNFLLKKWVRKKDKIKLLTLLISKKLFYFGYSIGNKRNMQDLD